MGEKFNIDFTEEIYNIFKEADSYLLKSYSKSDQTVNELKIYRDLAHLQWQLMTQPELETDFYQDFFKKIDQEGSVFTEYFAGEYIENGFVEAVSQFFEEGEAREKDLNYRDFFQAMRNLCVIFSLQLEDGQPIGLTPEIYAYGMLYPYTDNFLDDPSVSLEEKRAFNRELALAIDGKVEGRQRVVELLEVIASRYPRPDYPELYRALHLLLDSQDESLDQQVTAGKDMEEITKISIRKGGAAVLVDAYLVKGKLTLEEARFAFYYGALLQLVDDFQDVEEDREEGSQTPFTEMTGHFDHAFNKMLYILDGFAPLESPSLLLRTIRSVVLLLLFQVASLYPECFSNSFLADLNGYSPVNLSFYRRVDWFISKQLDS